MATEPDGPSRLRFSYWWFLTPFMVVFAVVVIVASVARAPYVLFAPGSARSTEPLISVPSGMSHDSKGEILFTTVSVIQRPTYMQVLWGWLRSDIDVSPYKAVYGTRTVDENRAEGRADMNQSKLVAAKVALEKLGYPVESTGTGVLLLAVDPSFPSAQVLAANDTIVAFDGKAVTLDGQLIDLIQAHNAGDKVELTIEPAGKRGKRTVTTTLGKRPDDGSPVLGVSIQTRDLKFELPFDVGIDSGRVGGPSAGLAFTLGTLDRLTPGSISGGKRVAVTGAMSADGKVLEVGGVEQKAIAARRAGAVLFIVPPQEYKDALKTAGDMPVVKAATVDEALAALARLGGNGLKLGQPGASAPG